MMQRTFDLPLYSTITVPGPDRELARGRRDRRDPRAMTRSKNHQDTSQRTDTDFIRDLVVEFCKTAVGIRNAPRPL
jgi:hypothetical protein